MTEAYENFMVYELNDDGQRIKLKITEEDFRENNGMNVLHSEQVVVIIKEDIRRIYIWKGAKSSVRKRFISSRVASQLQEELVKNAAFHRCKIVSVDQGDEVEEFLKTFRFNSIPVTEKLADMRYIRNIDRDKMLDAGIILDKGPKFVKIEKKDEEMIKTPKIEVQKIESKIRPTPSISTVSKPKSVLSTSTRSVALPSQRSSTAKTVAIGISEEESNTIKEKILKIDVPQGYKRQNLILGFTLYGAINKVVNVLGKRIQETTWDNVKKVPGGMIEINNQKIRVYFDSKKGIVEAIEILEKDNSEKKPSADKLSTNNIKSTANKVSTNKKKPATKKRPTPKKKPATKKKPAAKKRPAVKKKSAATKFSGTRKLPKIPSDKN